jgi:hypothetical protein
VGTLIGADSLRRDTIGVTTLCLDDIIPPGSRIDVVKIDAEGAELRVLSDMQRMVTENPHPVVVAEFGTSHLRAQGVSIPDSLGQFARAGLHVASEIDGNVSTVVPLRPVGAVEEGYSINIASSATLDALSATNRPQ